MAEARTERVFGYAVRQGRLAFAVAANNRTEAAALMGVRLDHFIAGQLPVNCLTKSVALAYPGQVISVHADGSHRLCGKAPFKP
jgi:hypothetical protein